MRTSFINDAAPQSQCHPVAASLPSKCYPVDHQELERRLFIHEVRHFSRWRDVWPVVHPESHGLTSRCPQSSVYVPKSATPLSKLPVLVYIHGGSFVYASSTDAGLDGSTLADKGGIIVITIQYRLGVFGLLRSSALGIEGNMAVWDVIEALSECRPLKLGSL